jgi:co-chaperonin GroES (HSP10)
MAEKAPKEAKKTEKPEKSALDEAYVSVEDRVLDPTKIPASVLERLPKPTGWRLLVLPYRGQGKTKGGVLLSDGYVEQQTLATVVGLVLAVGPDAYNDVNKFPAGPWCKKNDWIMFGRYAGSRFKIDGGEVRILNDDEVIATIADPEDILNV